MGKDDDSFIYAVFAVEKIVKKTSPEYGACFLGNQLKHEKVSSMTI